MVRGRRFKCRVSRAQAARKGEWADDGSACNRPVRQISRLVWKDPRLGRGLARPQQMTDPSGIIVRSASRSSFDRGEGTCQTAIPRYGRNSEGCLAGSVERASCRAAAMPMDWFRAICRRNPNGTSLLSASSNSHHAMAWYHQESGLSPKAMHYSATGGEIMMCADGVPGRMIQGPPGASGRSGMPVLACVA